MSAISAARATRIRFPDLLRLPPQSRAVPHPAVVLMPSIQPLPQLRKYAAAQLPHKLTKPKIRLLGGEPPRRLELHAGGMSPGVRSRRRAFVAADVAPLPGVGSEGGFCSLA